ncbi:type IV pilus twitching motility protein PilT [Geothrix fermentans]|uniref:type IV pilus twitching motility protein PilT n=1 Tax=Geothrix fermentans TaxID=44676 RepID=UPI000411756E|nr:PilT/PilU family type 4a pilus ATPase [Geothrix fermentans]
MPQIDRLLSHVIARGGIRLHLQADRKPSLELREGGAVDILPNPLPAVMVDVLAGEVVPPHLKSAWQTDGKADFEHQLEGQVFMLRLSRDASGSRLIAEWQDTARPQPPAEAPAATPAIAPPSPTIRPAAGHTHPLAERLFSALLAQQGSDLHCTSMEPPLVRVHGDMKELEGFGRLEPATMLEMMEGLATPAAWHHFQERHDADFAYAYEAGGCRLRVNYFMDRVGPGLVCRVIPNQIPDPDKLGLPDPVRRLCDLSKGLVLVTGPTGSGKSTTLAAILDLANQKRHDHILTIEDPIEFVHPRKGCLVNQREVGTHTESFKNGLRAALREDPDIILVGEMRDLETIAIALETAITGHLVFGTLHTSSAIGTIDRIVDQFPADRQQQIRVMLADALKCVISQTLLKKIGGGRIAALETLFISPAIANLIREGKNFQIPSSMQTGRSYGQRLMNDALVELIKDKKVEPMEAYLKCPDKESFISACKRAGIPFDLRLGEVEA